MDLEKLKEAFDPNGVMSYGNIFYQEDCAHFQK